MGLYIRIIIVGRIYVYRSTYLHTYLPTYRRAADAAGACVEWAVDRLGL